MRSEGIRSVDTGYYFNNRDWSCRLVGIGIGLAVWWVIDGVIRVYKGDIDGNTGKI
jgi:hypothetical protein